VRKSFYEDDCFLECYAMWSVTYLLTFERTEKNLDFSARLCIATSQKTIIIITTAVRTSPLAGQIYFRAVVILYTTKMVKIIIFVVISS